MSTCGQKRGLALKSVVAAAAMAGAIAAASPASALVIKTNVSIYGVTDTHNENITLHSNNLPPHSWSYSSSSYYSTGAGQVKLTTDQGTLYAWCLELAGNGSVSFYDSLSQVQIEKIAYLAWYGDTYIPTAPSNTRNALAAAVEAEIWNVEYGLQTPSTSAPTFAYSSDSHFQSELSILNTALLDASNYSRYRGYIVEDNKYSSCGSGQCKFYFVPTPEPETLVVFGAALLGMGAARRRTKKSA